VKTCPIGDCGLRQSSAAKAAVLLGREDANNCTWNLCQMSIDPAVDRACNCFSGPANRPSARRRRAMARLRVFASSRLSGSSFADPDLRSPIPHSRFL